MLAYHPAVRIAVSSLIALLLAGCASGAGPASSASPTAATATLAAPSLKPPAASPTLHIDRPPNDEVTITGAFGYDDVEGGCAFVQTDPKTRYEVVWPDGWTVDGTQLRNPNGDVAAQPGDVMTLRGTPATDMASVCQIGPIFRASEVVTIDR